MKVYCKYLFAALATTAMLAGCVKEITPPDFENDKVNPSAEGSRVIAVSFAPQTKTALSGDFQPVFVDGDKILVANGIDDPDTCVVSVKDKKATISTNLTGPLTAVYPAKAAKIDGQSPKAIGGVLVPSSQSGKFKDANICMAENITTSASFENKTALFQITPPIGATTFTITSLRQIGTDGQRSGTAVAINTEGADDAAKRIITVTVPAGGTAYVSLVSGVKLTDLSIDAGGTYGMKGIPKSKLGTYKDETAVNTKYTIDSDNWHPYVTIGNLKWATMNIGATETNPYGTYFSWGDVQGQEVSTRTGTSPTANAFTIEYVPTISIANAFTDEFSWTKCPFVAETTEPKLEKYASTSAYAEQYRADGFAGDTKTVLDLADDAANAKWGGSWRMPTGGTDSLADFHALAIACTGVYSNITIVYTGRVYTVPTTPGVYFYNVTGSKGVYFVDDSGNKLFFPAAGYGDGTDLYELDKRGSYWSGSLRPAFPRQAWHFQFLTGNGSLDYCDSRYYGYSVRPVADL